MATKKSGRPKTLASSEEQTRMVCTRFSPKTLAALERMGKAQDRSISWLVRKAADEFVQHHDNDPKGEGF
jgi:molybdopterin-guanine dinucleotide biosynthesis protein A